MGITLAFPDIAKRMRQENATDVHIAIDSPIMFRIDGRLEERFGIVSEQYMLKLCQSITNEDQWQQLRQKQEMDFTFEVKGMGYFRTNLFLKRGKLAGAFRYLPATIPSFHSLGLPDIARKFSELPNGLVLVSGAAGSGKSTTLAAMIDYINTHRKCHIVTIEDPIEYVHQNKTSLISQREVYSDTRSFKKALSATLRQDPDVVLVGEMRDLDTIELTLTVAETGHLTFATLHTNSAAQAITRLIDVFPANQQAQVRTQLSFVLQGIIWQQLIPHASGKGRVLALEILAITPPIRNLIRDGRLHQIYSTMHTGQASSGMQTMNQSLVNLLKDEQITLEDCLSHSNQINELQEMLQREHLV